MTVAMPEANNDPPQRTKRQRRNLTWLLIHVLVYLPMRWWCRTHVIGRENLDSNRGGILLINHQSGMDPLFVAVRLNRPVSYLARDTLFRLPIVGWICRHTYVIPISRTAFRGGSIRTALDRVNQGFLVGIFPEGTRSSGEPQTFRPGFLSLVRRAEAPIYPVAVVGADRVLPRGAWFVRPGKVIIVYGQPLTAEEQEQLCGSGDDKAAAALMQQRVTDLYRRVSPPALTESTKTESTKEVP
ncbi:MAG: lysophospholipid acyltransferase family protein [Fuerstiella sp.]